MTESRADAQADLLFLHRDQNGKRDDAATECVTIMPSASHFSCDVVQPQHCELWQAKLWQCSACPGKVDAGSPTRICAKRDD